MRCLHKSFYVLLCGFCFFIVGVVFWISLFCCVGIVVGFSCGWRIEWSLSWCGVLELVGGIVGSETRTNFHYVICPHFPPLTNLGRRKMGPCGKHPATPFVFFLLYILPNQTVGNYCHFFILFTPFLSSAKSTSTNVKRMIDFRPMNSCCHSIASLYVLGPCTCLYFLHLYDTSSTYIFCCIMYVNFLFLLWFFFFSVFNWTLFCLNRYWRRILTGKMCSGHRRVFGLQEKNTHSLGFIFYLWISKSL